MCWYSCHFSITFCSQTESTFFLGRKESVDRNDIIVNGLLFKLHSIFKPNIAKGNQLSLADDIYILTRFSTYELRYEEGSFRNIPSAMQSRHNAEPIIEAKFGSWISMSLNLSCMIVWNLSSLGPRVQKYRLLLNNCISHIFSLDYKCHLLSEFTIF